VIGVIYSIGVGMVHVHHIVNKCPGSTTAARGAVQWQYEHSIAVQELQQKP
jgi:hypothetical protein